MLFASGCGDDGLATEGGVLFVQPVSLVSSWNTDGTARVEGDIELVIDGSTRNAYALESITVTPIDTGDATPFTVQVEIDESEWPVEVDGSGAEATRRVHFVATGDLPTIDFGFCPTQTAYNISVELLTLDGSMVGSNAALASHTCPSCEPNAEWTEPFDWLSVSQQAPGTVEAIEDVVVDPSGDVFIVVASVNGASLERVESDNQFKRLDFDPRHAIIVSGRVTTGDEPGALVYWSEYSSEQVLSRLDRSGEEIWTHSIRGSTQSLAFAASGGRVFFAAGGESGALVDGVELAAPEGRTMLASVDELSGALIATGSSDTVVSKMLPGPNGTVAVMGDFQGDVSLQMFDRDLSLLWKAELRPLQIVVPAVVTASGDVFVADADSVYKFGPDDPSGTLTHVLPYVLSSLTRTEDGDLLAGGRGGVSRLHANGEIEALTGSATGRLIWCPTILEYRVGYGGASPAFAFVSFDALTFGTPQLSVGRLAP